MPQDKPDCFGFQWHITDRCSGKCSHCYQEKFDREGEQSLDRLKRTADVVMEHFSVPVSINLTGGEPLLFPELFDLVSYVNHFDNVKEVNLITSAMNIDGYKTEQICRSGFSSLKISLESHIPSVNDSIRGQGHYEAVIRNIGNLRDAGQRIILMVTLGSYNYRAVPGLCALAGGLGIEGIIFERYVPLGRGKSQASSVLSHTQWKEVLCSICATADMETDPLELLPYKAFWVDVSSGLDDISVSGALCNLGISSMALMPDGTVFPCRRLPFSVGKLPEQSMSDILSRLVLYAPENISSRLAGPVCSSCRFEQCAGCRALVMALGGELFDDDPQCPLHSL